MSPSPDSLGGPVSTFGLGRQAEKRLRARGIVRAAQLWEALERWSPSVVRTITGEERAVLRSRMESSMRAAGVARRRDIPRFPVGGIRGPMSRSSELRSMRARTRDDRKGILPVLRRLRDRLPSSSLLLGHDPVGVLNQGSLGSCTGFGSTAQRQWLRQKHLSALFGYALAKWLEGRPDVEGSFQIYCFMGFYQIGQLPEAAYPYTDRPKSLPVEPYRPEAEPYKTLGFTDLILDDEDRDLQDVLFRAVLAGVLDEDLGPQPVSISVSMSGAKGASTHEEGRFIVPESSEVDPRAGGHAMCIMGYIDADDAIGIDGVDYAVAKNSWGEGWAANNPLGLPGYALIPMEYFRRPDLTWEGLLCYAEKSPMAGSHLRRLGSHADFSRR